MTKSSTRAAGADDVGYSHVDIVEPAELYQNPLNIGGIIATISNMSRKVTRALPEIGWGGGTWIYFEIEPENNFISTKNARKKSRAKRERREKVFLSDWEPGFRARCKAIALTNEVIRMRMIDEVPGCAEHDDVLPRPVLVAEGGGWISSTPVLLNSLNHSLLTDVCAMTSTPPFNNPPRLSKSGVVTILLESQDSANQREDCKQYLLPSS
jgi:hypothetical protein